MSVRKILHNRRKRHDPNYVPVKNETRKRVRLFVEEGAGWQGTDEEVQTLRKFYQVTFRDNPPDFTNCGKCFLRCCKRMLDYWREENRKKFED